ncbi:MAG: caspase family protein [Bacteroidetes bacterium]|nr:MAG: caspase family protein [Bacteroidota bacterium]
MSFFSLIRVASSGPPSKWVLLLMWISGLWGADLPAQERFSRVYGGDKDEHAMGVVQAQDGSYVLTGFTFSEGAGKSDVWVMKVDAYGQEIWRQVMGGPDFDWANDLVETRDGNYVVAGYTRDSTSGARNAWVFALNRHGEQMWSHTYGGDQADEARAIIQTRDGGFAVAGYSYSFARGESDLWMLRLDAVGQARWEKTYGGTGTEQAYALAETEDEGFVIGGYQSYGEPQLADMLVVRTDRHGKGIWRRALPAPGNAAVEGIRVLPNGQFLAVGWGYPPGGKSLDACVVRLGPSGQILDTHWYGGDDKDTAYDLIPVAGGNYVMAGQTASRDGSSDAWLVGLDGQLQEQWQRYTQGQGRDWAHALAPAHDGGFAVAGGTSSYARSGSDILFLKTDAQGNFDQGPVQAELVLPPREDHPEDYTTKAAPLKPNLYVLAIGVSQYQDSSIRLHFAHQDAVALSQAFQATEGRLFGRVETRVITDEAATLGTIKRGIAWLEQQATQKDMVLIFVSSHGALDHKGNLYILPYDFNAQSLFATGLNIRDLTEGINGTPCKKLILLDACHSGQSAYDYFELATAKASNLNEAVADLVQTESGITVMTSSSGREFSYEHPDWGHGAFTKALLEGLRGEADFNGDRVVRLIELNLYVTERVKTLTEGRQHPFTPINQFGDIPLLILD